MEAVDVLERVDAVDDAILVDGLRQRRLHENAVDARILVQGFDPVFEICLGDVGGQVLEI